VYGKYLQPRNSSSNKVNVAEHSHSLTLPPIMLRIQEAMANRRPFNLHPPSHVLHHRRHPVIRRPPLRPRSRRHFHRLHCPHLHHLRLHGTTHSLFIFFSFAIFLSYQPTLSSLRCSFSSWVWRVHLRRCVARPTAPDTTACWAFICNARGLFCRCPRF